MDEPATATPRRPARRWSRIGRSSLAAAAAVVAVLWAATAVDETGAASHEVAAVFAAACADQAEDAEPAADAADDAATDHAAARREVAAAFHGLDEVVSWRATSPAIDTGDCYTIRLTNGAAAQSVYVRAVVMDHANQVNTPVVSELRRLAAGETLTLQAVNDYGPANHFSTTIVSAAEDLAFEVTVADEAGEAIAWYSDQAFMVERRTPGERTGRRPHEHEADQPD